MKKPLEFKAKRVMVDGKETVQIEPIAEIIKHADGMGQDVIMHMPSLALINQFKEANGF